MEITATINEEGKAVLDLSQAVSEKEEIATIKDENGDTIYDVNYPDNTKDGYTYDSTNNTLTIDNIDDLSGGLSITAEKVKVLLYDAKLAIDGRKYSATLSNPIGKYSKPSEAYAAVSEDTFSNGIYIQLQSDIEGDSVYFNIPANKITVDLNGHKWSKGSNNERLIRAEVDNSSYSITIIDGYLSDNSLRPSSDQLGSALYVNNKAANTNSIQDWISNLNRDNWLKVYINDVTFSNNYADGGGAICINGAVELNVYDSEFKGNKTANFLKDDEAGRGAAIYIWSVGSSQGEIVNLYDCSSIENEGCGLFNMEGLNSGVDVLFNIYGGRFTGNTLLNNTKLLAIQSFNIYGGNFLDETLSDNKGNSNPISINGGIIDTLEINGSNDLTLNGGSVGSLTGNHSSDSSKELVSATLPNAAKVEYIEYTTTSGNKQVNINSPFILDDSDDGVCYSYENNFGNPAKDKIFNNSEYNPAIKEFNVFLPSSEVDLVANFESGGYGLVFVNGYAKNLAYVSSAYKEAKVPTISTINTKYSIAGSYDGKTLKVYMNGNLASSLSLTGSIGTAGSSTVMAIGANPAGSSVNGNYYNGRVYSVRIYNRALTDAEIQENYKVDNSNYKIN